MEAPNEQNSNNLAEMKNNGVVKKNLPRVRDYTKADWLRFREIFNTDWNMVHNLETESDVDQVIWFMSLLINKSISKTVPMNTDLEDLKKLRNLYRRTLQKHNLYYGNEVRELKSKLNRINKLIKISAQERREAQNKPQASPYSNSNLWQYVKFLTKKPNKLDCESQDNDSLAETLEKNLTLTTQFQREKDYEKIVKIVRVNEIKKALEVPMKATGRGGIEDVLMKNLPMKALAQFKIIFNSCFRLSYFPDSWEKAELEIKKRGVVKRVLSNNRDKSFLFVLGNVFENVMIKRIHKHEKKIQQ